MQRYYGRGVHNSSSGDGQGQPPFRCDGYVDQGTLRDAHGHGMPLSDLPPFLRALLVTDGTVTKILEAYFWEPVVVDTLEQRFEVAEAPVPWITLATGDRCLIRDARLRGLRSGRAYAEAFSVIRTELIPEGFRRRLIDREIGIGVLIRDSGLESYREVLDVGLDSDQPGKTSVFRTYRIVIDGHPVILISEYFPLEIYLGA
jgi:chorismate-pyruvate lyase